MRNIDILRKKIKPDCFPDTVLFSALGDKKYWTASRLVEKGEIERVKLGLYVFGEDYRRQALNLYAISNVVYGPSYVSLEAALSYYQLIPERVVEVTCVNPKRTKKFDTPIGRFSFRKVPATAFSFGLNHVGTKSGSFLIASKEKSLMDKLYLDASRNSALDYCLESLRIEESDLKKFKLASMLKLAKLYSNNNFEEQIKTLVCEIKAV